MEVRGYGDLGNEIKEYRMVGAEAEGKGDFALEFPPSPLGFALGARYVDGVTYCSFVAWLDIGDLGYFVCYRLPHERAIMFGMTIRRNRSVVCWVFALMLVGRGVVVADTSSGKADRPNVLVIMTDEHNASVTGCYGSKIVPHAEPGSTGVAGRGLRCCLH